MTMFSSDPPRSMKTSLRVLAALLGYPDACLHNHLAEMRDLVLGERVLSASRQLELVTLIDKLLRADSTRKLVLIDLGGFDGNMVIPPP